MLEDIPSTRLALRCWLGINRATSRAWVKGDATREQAALILTETLHQIITSVAPALAHAPDDHQNRARDAHPARGRARVLGHRR